MSDTPDDAFLEAQIEGAVAPYRAMGLSPAVLLDMAAMLRSALTTDPTGRYLLHRARPRAVEGSGSVPTGARNDGGKTGTAR
jgi:hypothetical protein